MSNRPWAIRQYKGTEKKPFLLKLDRQQPKTVKQMQYEGMRCVPITLVKIPESRILTKEELE